MAGAGGLLRAAESGEEVVEAFFSPAGRLDRATRYTGEMRAHAEEKTLGEFYGPGARKAVRLLERGATREVYGVEVRHPAGVQDWYLYLRKEEERWRLAEVRTLSETGTLRMGLERLREVKGRTAEQEWQRRNLELTLASDAELKAYVRENRAAFDALAALVSDGSAGAANAARRLHLQRATRREDGVVRALLGGVLDNTVGYLALAEGGTAPPMDPDRFILVERAAGRWILFKTT